MKATLCVLCGATSPRGIICARCASQQQASMYTSMATDYLTSRKAARSLRIHRNRLHHDKVRP